MSVAEVTDPPRRKWSRLGQLARGAALAQAKRGSVVNPNTVLWTEAEKQTLVEA
jgi:hypothetical protein